MVKKKGAASKQKGASVAATPAKEVQDEPAADTVMQVLNRRIRAAKKKIQKIAVIEEAQAAGKEINDDQVKTLESKVQVNAILEELARVEPLVEKALKKEIDGAVEKAVAAAKAENVPSEADEEVESSTIDSSSEPKVEADEAGQILDLLYVSQVFGFGGTEADYEAFLSAEESNEGKPITRQDLEKLAGFGKSLFTRSVEDGFTHEEALSRCKSLALAFIRTPSALVDTETSVAEITNIVSRLKASDFFKQEIVIPVQTAPEPVMATPPAEESTPDPVPEMDPAVQAPTITPETVAVGQVPDPHMPSGAAPEPFNPVPPSQPQQEAAGGAPPMARSFLPFSSLSSMPLSTPPHAPPPTFSNQIPPPNNMAFGVNNSAAPGGYMQPQASGYGTPTPQDPPAETNVSGAPPPQASEVEHQTVVEPEMVTAPPQDSLLQHPPQARHSQPMDMKPPPRGPPQEPPKHAPAQPAEQGGLEARPRGPGGPPRRSRGYDGGQGGFQRHGGQGGPMGGQGPPYGGGGRGPSHVWNGGFNNYGGGGGGGGGGYRGGSWEGGRGRGRGRSGGNYGGVSGDGGYGGRGPGPNSYSRGGGGRGGRGGFRGRGGAPWNRPPPQFAQSQDHS